MEMSKKRQNFTDKFRAKVALEAVRGDKTLSQLAAEYKVHANLISKWKKKLISEAHELFSKGSNCKAKSEEELTTPLYEEIGRLKMDVRWLEKKL
jgi:transposase-like protein